MDVEEARAAQNLDRCPERVFKKSVTFETRIVILSVLAKDLHLATRNADASEYLSMTTSQFLPPRDFLSTLSG
ncbi:MAG: hypothetical protein QOE14_388 [Humisphaera sp.]|nr:hypothetical protein [Humisphaera sp.]